MQDSDVYIEDGSCVYPNSPALALGFLAALFAIIIQIYIDVTSGGFSCCRNDPNSITTSKLLYILSWRSSVVAMVLLLAATGLDDKEGGEVDSYGYFTCYVVKPEIFSAGAVLAFLSAILEIVVCVTLSSIITEVITNSTVGTTDEDLEKSPINCTPQHSTQQQK